MIRLFIFIGLIHNLHAATEKEVDSFLDSLSESRWLSSTTGRSQNRVFLTENDDLYHAIREKLIQTLRGKKIHSLTYLNYSDDHRLAVFVEHDENSVKIQLVNNESCKVDSKFKKSSALNSKDFMSEWKAGKNSTEANLQPKKFGKVYENMLQPRLKGLLHACFLYENRLNLSSIISLKEKGLINFEQAITVGLYHDYNVNKYNRSFIEEHAADWSKKNDILFEMWGFENGSFEKFFKSQAGAQSRLRWTHLLN